jgi:hypothetical protein
MTQVEVKTMAIFTKLFETKMVANNSWGFSIRWLMFLNPLLFPSLTWVSSEGSNEKKAISLAEIKAENKSRIKVSIKPPIALRLKGKKVILRLLNITH